MISSGIKYPIFFLILFFTSSLLAQNYNVKFKHIGIPDGLSNNHITDILQDELGYMWIATERGLNRYDGEQMIKFPNGTDSIAVPFDHHIIDLERNINGGIWILTRKGVLLYKNGVFKRKQISSDPDIFINQAEIIDKKNWFFTNAGIYSYDNEQDVFDKIRIARNADFKYSFINDAGISTALLDSNLNQIWICTIEK